MNFFPHASLVIGLVLALATAVAFNWSWVAQHAITSQLPRLELRRPMWSLKLLFAHRRWLVAFLVGIVGWAFYPVWSANEFHPYGSAFWRGLRWLGLLLGPGGLILLFTGYTQGLFMRRTIVEQAPAEPVASTQVTTPE